MLALSCLALGKSRMVMAMNVSQGKAGRENASVRCVYIRCRHGIRCWGERWCVDIGGKEPRRRFRMEWDIDRHFIYAGPIDGRERSSGGVIGRWPGAAKGRGRGR